jgi:hypothetical protein
LIDPRESEIYDRLFNRDAGEADRRIAHTDRELADRKLSGLWLVEEAVAELQKLVGGLVQHRIKVLNAGDYAAVPAEFMKWVFGGGKKLPGLVTRRTAEAAMFEDVARTVRRA